MGRIIAKNVRGMNWMAKISLVLIFTLVFSTFLNEGLYQPKSAEAAPVALLDNGGANWSAGTLGTGGTSSTHTYTAPAGSNRAVIVHITGEGANPTITNVTIGGVNATPIGAISGGNAFAAAYYRLIGTSASTTSADVVVTWGTTPSTGWAVNAATYGGVLQTGGTGAGTAINTFGTAAANTSGTITVSNITCLTDGIVVYQLAENAGTVGNVTSGTWTFSQMWSATPSSYGASGGHSNSVAGTDSVSSTTTQNRQAMVVLSLAPAPSGDTTPPTVSSVAVQSGSTVDVTFSEAMGTGVTTAANYTVSGTGRGTLATNPNSVALVSGNTYRLTWTGGEMLNGGNITITVANAQDVAGNPIGTPNSGTDTGGAIGVAPTVTINQAGGQADPTSTSPINFAVVFSESVSNFATGDVTITGTAGGTKTATVTGSGTTYNVAVSGMTTSGTVIADIAAGVATDAAGNPNTASTSTDKTVQWNAPPTCTHNPPTVGLAPASGTITTDGGNVVYTLTVTNNDSAACTNETFNLTRSDSNTTNFNASTLSTTSLVLAPGATSSTVTLTVSALAGQTTGTNTSSVSAGNATHTPATVSNNVTTTISTVTSNPLIHNSITTQSTKHAADGGWGIATGKYGEFVCTTCHTDTTTNIKRVKETITAPNAPTENFPGSAVVFTRTSGVSTDTGLFGVDASPATPRTSSNRVCEVCHTYDASGAAGVQAHPYATTATLGNHQNGDAKDCISCHKHNSGFGAPDCNSCHGNPPIVNTGGANGLANSPYPTGSTTAGAHGTHATTLGYNCTACHNNYVMPQESTVKPGFGDISISFSTFGATTGSYTGQANVSYNNTLGTGTKTCSTVYCHGTTIGGTNPVWDGTVVCGNCHGATAGTPPTLGSHTQHAGSGAGNYSLSCTTCHTAVTDGTHVNGDVAWSISTTDPRSNGGLYKGAASGTTGGLAPSATYGSCSTLYCHGNFGGNGNNASPTWGSASSGNCGTCHDVDTSPTMDGGSHDRHVHGGLSITCDYCHEGTAVNAAGGIQSTTLHVNGSLDWNLLRTNSRIGTSGTYRGAETGTRATAQVGTLPYGQCSGIYCHSNVQSSPPGGALTYGTPTWGGTVNCGDCHKAGPAGGAAEQDSGSHLKHVSASQYNIACAQCHQGAGSGTVNHANAQVNVTINATWGGTYGGTTTPGDAYGSCSTVYCHSAGQSSTGGALGAGDYKTQAWGQSTALGCAGCHKNMDTDATAPGSHVQHAQTGGIACATCHTGYTETTAATSTHVNKSINVAIEATYGGTYNGTATPGDGFSTCSASTCHGTTSPAWGANTADATCVKCHGIATSSPAQYTADPNRAAPGYTAASAPTGPGRDTAGQTGTVTSNVSNDAQVGAHDTHLRSLGGYKTGGVACSDCHAVTNITDAGHMNGSSTMTWSNLAKNIGTVPYNADNGPITPGYTSPNCTTNYCHGGGFAAPVQGTGTTVSWVNGNYLANAGSAMNSADCNRCHQSPPTSSAKYNHSGITLGAGNCSGCHNHDGYGDARHVNGTLEASGGACDGCHGYGPSATDGKPERAIEGKGAHAKHVAHLVARWGGTLNATTDQFGSGASWTNVCGVCHNGASHNMGEPIGGTGRTISIPASYQFGASAPAYNGTVGVSSATTPKSCSNISCHYSTTPVWSAY